MIVTSGRTESTDARMSSASMPRSPKTRKASATAARGSAAIQSVISTASMRGSIVRFSSPNPLPMATPPASVRSTMRCRVSGARREVPRADIGCQKQEVYARIVATGPPASVLAGRTVPDRPLELAAYRRNRLATAYSSAAKHRVVACVCTRYETSAANFPITSRSCPATSAFSRGCLPLNTVAPTKIQSPRPLAGRRSQMTCGFRHAPTRRRTGRGMYR